MRPPSVRLLAAAGAGALLLASLLATGPAPAAAAVNAPSHGDITSLITADGGRDDIVLKGGNYTITLPADAPSVQEASGLPKTPETIYHGSISGTGTLTVRPPAGGRASLVMTGLSTWSLPSSRLRTWSTKQAFATYGYDGVTLNGGKSPWDVDVQQGQTNDPALTIASGAIVHLDDLDGGRANIESYVGAHGRTSGAYNEDGIQVDGTLVFTNNHFSPYQSTIGPLSGSGDFINDAGGFRLSGTSTISGHVSLYGANINGAWAWGRLTGVSKIYDALDLAYGATPETIAPSGAQSSSGVEVVPQTIYECCYGNAVYNIGAGDVRFTGMYSYSDSQDPLHPALSNPKLNYVAFPKGNSQRIVDLGQGITTFGDGTSADFWLPSGWGNAYIGTHQAYALGLDYNGTVRMNVPINKADAVDGLNLFILGTRGNKVIVTQPLYFHGFTRIDPTAVLQLGDGTKGNENSHYTFYNKQISGQDTGTYSTSSGSGRILTADVAPGAAGDRIIDNGSLVVADVKGAYSGVGALSLSDISGRGSVEQRGPATLTLLSHLSYTGATKVSGGTLALGRSRRGRASLAASSGVDLSASGARLSIAAAGPQTLRSLTGVAGSQILLGAQTLTVAPTTTATYAGDFQGSTAGTLLKSGKGTLTLLGHAGEAGPVQLTEGSLVLGSKTHQAEVTGPVTTTAGTSLVVHQAGTGALTNAGTLAVDGPLTLNSGLTMRPQSTLQLSVTGGAPAKITASGAVHLAGHLHLTGRPTGPLTVVDTQGKGSITGAFDHLPEGAKISADGVPMTISYHGGADGQAVVLTPEKGALGALDSLAHDSAPLSGHRGLAALASVPVLLAAAAAFLVIRRRRRSTQPAH